MSKLAKKKLTYHFHNPNPVEDTADHILKILLEVHRVKIENQLREAALQQQVPQQTEDAAGK